MYYLIVFIEVRPYLYGLQKCNTSLICLHCLSFTNFQYVIHVSGDVINAHIRPGMTSRRGGEVPRSTVGRLDRAARAWTTQRHMVPSEHVGSAPLLPALPKVLRKPKVRQTFAQDFANALI